MSPTGMCMTMIGNLSHHLVNSIGSLSDDAVRNSAKSDEHVRSFLLRRRASMSLEHYHWNRAGLTLGDPTYVVVVIPLGHPLGIAELT